MSEVVTLSKQLTEEILKLIGLEGTVSVSEEDIYVHVQIDAEETGILIGYHGETLLSLQVILAQMLFKKLGEWKSVTVNVGDYQQKREDQLLSMADRIADQVVEEQRSIAFPFLNARERRLVHMFLKEDPEVYSESVGEDAERRLVVFPKLKSVPVSQNDID